MRITRFLKTTLFLSSSSYIYFNYFLTGQQQQNINGVYRCMTNSLRASYILCLSIYDYYQQLKNIEYNSQQYHKKRSQIHTRVAKRILQISKQNKGIYLKLGQYLGNLQKVVPWQFTQILKVLQDSAPPISFDQIKITFQDDFKKKINQVYSQFDQQAIAAASLAQVHRAVLKQTNQTVAVKLQFPFLKVQSKYDLIILKKIVQFCNYLMEKRNYKDIDLIRLYQTWTNTLVQQLDFRKQLSNALQTSQLFSSYPSLHIPQYYKQYSSQRVITMQFIKGSKINNPKQISLMGISPIQCAHNLISIFTQMIFKYGFIHCDAHPGNILVRKCENYDKKNKKYKKNKLGHEIVLLDHGLYRKVNKQFVECFSGLWLGLLENDTQKVILYAQKLNIHKHIQYLPIIFLLRTVNSTKKYGQPMTQQQKNYFRQKDLANFQSINKILQDLPPDLMFIIRASNLIAIHNLTLGGTTRERLFQYTNNAIKQYLHLYENLILGCFMGMGSKAAIIRLKYWLKCGCLRILIGFIGNCLEFQISINLKITIKLNQIKRIKIKLSRIQLKWRIKDKLYEYQILIIFISVH